jgi:hypothetical protein
MTGMELLHDLAAANFHHPGLRAGLIAQTVPDFENIVEDCRRLVAEYPPSTVQTGHITGWTNPKGTVNQWSLYNTHGNTANTSDDFKYNNLDRKRPVLGFPALSAFVDSLPDLVNMRLNLMWPGSALSPHEEHLPRKVPGGVALRARFHLPVWTNPGAVMMADGDLHHFEAGKIYVFNNGCVHSAWNAGDQPRAHLVWDQLMTERAYTKAFANFEPLTPVAHEEIGEYATQGGMSEADYSRRRLVFHP